MPDSWARASDRWPRSQKYGADRLISLECPTRTPIGTVRLIVLLGGSIHLKQHFKSIIKDTEVPENRYIRISCRHGREGGNRFASRCKSLHQLSYRPKDYPFLGPCCKLGVCHCGKYSLARLSASLKIGFPAWGYCLVASFIVHTICRSMDTR